MQFTEEPCFVIFRDRSDDRIVATFAAQLFWAGHNWIFSHHENSDPVYVPDFS